MIRCLVADRAHGGGVKSRGWRRVATATWGQPNDPQIYGDIEVEAQGVEAFLSAARAASSVRITVNHLVGKAVARALAEQPDVNARLVGGSFRPRESADVFFIVLSDEGRDLSGVKGVGADRMSLAELPLTRLGRDRLHRVQGQGRGSEVSCRGSDIRRRVMTKAL